MYILLRMVLLLNKDNDKMIICENLIKIYKTAEIEVVALSGLDLEVNTGEVIAVIGNSGSGKSTLLNMLGGLDRPSAGSLTVDGKDLLSLTDRQSVKYKRDTIGFVWQNNARNLIPYLTALENVEVPMIFKGRRRRERANELLEIVGLEKRKKSKMTELSGGEQQRVAIAIAMANKPKLILADEPTGSVDTSTTGMIIDVFNEVNRVTGVTVVIVTHDLQISRKVERVVAIRDGRTSSEFVRRRSYREEMEELKDGIADTVEESHVELAIVDKVGRVQIPKKYLDDLALKGKKIKVEQEKGKIILIAPDDEHENTDHYSKDRK